MQIAAVFEEAWAPEYTYIGVIIDMDTIQKLQVSPLIYLSMCAHLSHQLELTLDDIKWAIVATRKLKIKQEVRSVSSICCHKTYCR